MNKTKLIIDNSEITDQLNEKQLATLCSWISKGYFGKNKCPWNFEKNRISQN